MQGISAPTSAASSAVDGDQAAQPSPLECFICMQPPTDPVAASCGHVFCWSCMHRWLQNRPQPCPVCGRPLRRGLAILASANAIPPGPRSPLVTDTASIESEANGSPLVTDTASIESEADESLFPIRFVLTPPSVLSTYERSMRQLSDALVDERDRVLFLTKERGDLELKVHRCVQRNVDLRRQMQQTDRCRLRQVFLERNRQRQIFSERRNLALVREGEESRERERELTERELLMCEYIASLQERVDPANYLLQPWWS